LVAEMTAIPVGQAQLKREGRSGLAILAFGALVDSAVKIGERLDATVVNMRFVKPLDERMVLSIAERHSAIVTIEENAVMGGAGAAVGELLAEKGVQLPLHHIGIPDLFIEHGTRESCLAAAGLDLAGLTANVEGFWSRQPSSRMRSASGA
jgi:1-deoxy-D-xylulose-5-phosphate synthase